MEGQAFADVIWGNTAVCGQENYSRATPHNPPQSKTLSATLPLVVTLPRSILPPTSRPTTPNMMQYCGLKPYLNFASYMLS